MDLFFHFETFSLRLFGSEFPMGSDVLDQQVSCLWQNNYLLSVSLSGFINYLDVNNPTKPLRVVKGHNRTITALAINTVSADQQRLYTGSCDGYITHWNPQNGEHDRIVGRTHTNQVSGMVFDGDNRIYSAGFDDIIRTIDVNTNEFIGEFKLDQQPQGLALSSDKQILFIACHSQLQVRRAHDGGILSVVTAPYEPSSIACNQQTGDIAVGGNRDSKVHVYKFDGQKLNEQSSTTLDHRAGITDVAYSPDGKYLAASDQNRKIILYNSNDNYQLAHDLEWGYHVARVNCLAWSPDSSLLASGSLDTGIIIWDCVNPTKHFTLKSKFFFKLFILLIKKNFVYHNV